MAEPKKSFPKKSFVSKKETFVSRKVGTWFMTRAHLARSYCAEVFKSVNFFYKKIIPRYDTYIKGTLIVEVNQHHHAWQLDFE